MRTDSIKAGRYRETVRVFRIRPDGPYYSEIMRTVRVIDLEDGSRIYDAAHAQRWAELSAQELVTGDTAPRLEFERSIAGPAKVELIARRDYGSLYFIQCEVTLRVKIGCSRDPHARLKDLQVGCPTDLRLVAVVPRDGHSEWVEHSRFSEYRVRGEWFELHDDLLGHIRSIRKQCACEHYPEPLEPDFVASTDREEGDA